MCSVAEYCKRADVIKVSENLDKFGLTYLVPKARSCAARSSWPSEPPRHGIKTAERATDAAAEDKELEAMGWSATW